MGNGSSAEELESVGYRVLGVQENSPASKVGLVSFFDFIVAKGNFKEYLEDESIVLCPSCSCMSRANGVPLRQLDSTLVEMIKASEDRPLPLTIFNYKSMTTRDVELVPSKKWPGQGMLGVTIRFDSHHRAEEALVRVLEVAPGGPAQIAGLRPGTDYVLGTAEQAFGHPDALHAELVRHLDAPLEVYVYSTETDFVRTCIILPTEKWDGEGCLGCSVGSGYIHRLPQACRGTLGQSAAAPAGGARVAGRDFHPPPAPTMGTSAAAPEHGPRAGAPAPFGQQRAAAAAAGAAAGGAAAGDGGEGARPPRPPTSSSGAGAGAGGPAAHHMFPPNRPREASRSGAAAGGAAPAAGVGALGGPAGGGAGQGGAGGAGLPEIRAPQFRKRDFVIYQANGDTPPEEATIVKVHYDDIENGPYYTIVLSSDGREKQTVERKLKRKETEDNTRTSNEQNGPKLEQESQSDGNAEKTLDELADF